MKIYLILNSILLLLCYLPCKAEDIKENTSFPVGEMEFNMLIQYKDQEVTSLCILEVQEDHSIVGTVINEFGIKVFDFTFSNGKAKILNVLGPLNKWYIRNVIRGDFTFLLKNLPLHQNVKEKKRSLYYLNDNEIKCVNEKYKIIYTLTPMIR